VRLGIDKLVANHFKLLSGNNVGLCTNFSACDSQLRPTATLFAQQKKIRLKAIFFPEHGLYSALQDQKKAKDGRNKNLSIKSLYGKRLSPDLKSIERLDAVVIDLFDIGTRYYTFLWTAILIIEQMAKLQKRIIILDRPNPINGVVVQGPVLEPKYSSFVGLYPIPVRHGMTIGELCNLINIEYRIYADIKVIGMDGWRREWHYHQTGLHWTVPSPNMSSLETALVYPGMCLLEGTNISEGRGTTRPFEIFGAPWIEPHNLVTALQREKIPGVDFRPTYFIPTFHKYKDRLCGGAQVYINDLGVSDPVYAGLSIIKMTKELYPKAFRWRQPPYEFEMRKLPFDILIGNSWIRKGIEKNEPISAIKMKWQKDLDKFKKLRKKYLLYE